jgi:ADP-heptose:LPS heptosyltransferase
MKFLIIRFSSIGDIVLTTPVVRCLKKQVVTAEVHYLTKAVYRPLVESNPYIDKIHCLDNNWNQLMEELEREEFDYIIDLHHNLRTLKVKRRLKQKSYAFDKLNIHKWLYTNFHKNVMPDKHIVDRYLETVAAFGVRNDGGGLDYFIPEKEWVKENDIPASHHAGYIGIVLGAAHTTKKMPLHKWMELCKMIDHPLILLGGKEDKAAGDQVAAVDPHKIYNACGKFSIHESADLVRRSKLIITHDTGLMHIAAAFCKPVISIWGNTVPEFGMYPYYGQSAVNNNQQAALYDVMEIRPLACRPCSKIGYDKCPLGHFRCMEEIDVEDIYRKVLERLGRVK